MTETERKLAQANGRLKAGKVGVSIQIRGDRLYLQATLPPKPNSPKPDPHQQRIALGVKANGAGISFAEAEAKKIGGLLATKEFSWEPYLIDKGDRHTIANLIEDFEKDYFTRRQRNPKTLTTWEKDYLAVYRKLPQTEMLDLNLLIQAIATTPPDSRQRRRYCMALSTLAKFAGVEADLNRYKGSYSPKKVKPRDLPTDAEIQAWFDKIPNPEWRWVYGMLATYGLRPHEVFHTELDLYPIATVTEGKTGARRVWACYPEWCDRFNLAETRKPQITGRNNSELGRKAGIYFRRLGLPFRLYDLRHCWAVRSLEFGFDVSLAAQQMGHSVQVHVGIYHAWISDAHHQRAYDALMQRSDRPKPPADPLA